jgi:hypothetical protein
MAILQSPYELMECRYGKSQYRNLVLMEETMVKYDDFIDVYLIHKSFHGIPGFGFWIYGTDYTMNQIKNIIIEFEYTNTVNRDINFSYPRIIWNQYRTMYLYSSHFYSSYGSGI